MRHIHYVFKGDVTPVQYHAAIFIVDPSDHYLPVGDFRDAESEQCGSKPSQPNSVETGHEPYDDTDRASNSSAQTGNTVLYVGSDQHREVVQNPETAFDVSFTNTGFTPLLPGPPKSMEDTEVYPMKQSGGK